MTFLPLGVFHELHGKQNGKCSVCHPEHDTVLITFDGALVEEVASDVFVVWAAPGEWEIYTDDRGVRRARMGASA